MGKTAHRSNGSLAMKKLKMNDRVVKWFRRLGLAGFLFFLVKGLIWLAVFLGLGTVLNAC